jgi:hypothetical protein
MRPLLTGLGLMMWALFGMLIRRESFDLFVIKQLGRLGELSGPDWGRAAIASAVPFCGVLIASAGGWMIWRWRAARVEGSDDPRLPLWARLGTTVLLLPFGAAYVRNDFAQVIGINSTGAGIVTMLAFVVGVSTLWMALLFWPQRTTQP